MISISEEYLRRRSRELVAERIKESVLLKKGVPSENKEPHLALIQPNEVALGRLIGKGNFCEVLTLGEIKKRSENKTITRKKVSAYETISNNIRAKSGAHNYVIKRVMPGLYKKSNYFHFAQGLIDLSMEAQMLQSIQHPNIIKVVGLADVDDPSSTDFFIVLERLVLALEAQIEYWSQGISLDSMNKKVTRKSWEDIFCETLMVGHDICSALEYLHGKKIVYRDLKPENIGFNGMGELKVFDFGTAIEMTPTRRHEKTNTYLLTKKSGTPKYMAPENYNGIPYNEKCDIYSFALLLWQCLENKRPFESYDDAMMVARVFEGNEIPRLNRGWSGNFRALFIKCLCRDFCNRPTCGELKVILNTEVANMIGRKK